MQVEEAYMELVRELIANGLPINVALMEADRRILQVQQKRDEQDAAPPPKK